MVLADNQRTQQGRLANGTGREEGRKVQGSPQAAMTEVPVLVPDRFSRQSMMRSSLEFSTTSLHVSIWILLRILRCLLAILVSNSA